MSARSWSSLASILGARPCCAHARRQLRSAFLIPSVALALLFCGWNVALAQQQLRNHVRSEVTTGKAAYLGVLPPDQQLHLSIVLPLRNQAQLTSLLTRLYDPSSPDYRKFLTVDQFADQFGPTPQDYQAVVAFAQANGLTVTGTHANRLVVPIAGTVAQVNKAFNVSIGMYQHPTENRTFFSADREPSVSLSVPIAHVEGLNNFSIPRPMLVPGQNTAARANVTGSGPGGSYLGSDMRAAYYGGTTLTGVGQAVGILEFDGYYLDDVSLTFSSAGQSFSVPINNVLLDGAPGTPVQYNDAEQVLDIVQAIGMAPGLSQVRVYIGSNDADMLSSMASENIAKQLSCSWSWLPDDPATADVFFQEFAAQGQSFFAASGDNGAFDTAISSYFYPQEDAFVTSVGGTHLTTSGAAGAWQAETAWNSIEPGSSSAFGSTGGISPDGIPIPSWQSGVANSSNGGSATLRNVPDVAMEGDFDNYMCSNSSCLGDGAGTSFAAPRWAGFMALVNQQAVEAGNAPAGGLGFINPAIYTIAGGTGYSSDFHDITSGNNNTQNQPTWFSAVAGYDLVTGWGSANGQALIDALAGPQVPGFWISPSTANVSLNQGSSATDTITITDAGSFTDKVTLAVTSSLPTGVTASWGTNPTSSTSVLTLTSTANAPAGTATLTVTGTSGGLTQTTNITVTVHAPTFLLSASPNNVSMNPGGSGSSTITLTPQYGFSGSATLSVSGLPNGVTASWGTNPITGTSLLTLNASSTATPGPATLTIAGTSGSLTVSTTLSLTITAPSFTLFGSGTVNIGQGTSGNAYVYINSQYGFNGNVNFSVSGLPSGVTASFSPNPASGASTLTLTASSTTSTGNSTLTITGTSGSLTATTTMTLSVFSPTFTLSGPGTVSLGQGQTQSASVSVNGQYGFSGNVTFSLSSLPKGVTALWSPNPATSSTQLSFSASSTAATGQYPITITGTSGAQTATTAMTLGIYAPTFTLSSPGQITIGQGSSGSAYVYVNNQYGFTGNVSLSISGLPSGITASFTPNPTTYGSNVVFTVGSGVAVGQYPFTLTGTSGTQTATATGTVVVAVPTFTISSYGSVSAGQGTATTAYVYVNGQYGFSGSVNFSISGLPSGVTASFSPNPTAGSSMLTLTVGGSVAVGQYPLTITGTSGAQSTSTTLTLGVYVPSFTLSSYGATNIGQGTSTTVPVWIYSQYGFTGNVTLTASGLPSGVTATFSPNPSAGTSTMTLTASGTAPLGQSTITITGTSGSLTATTTLGIGVYAPAFTLSAGGLNLGQGSSGTVYVNVSQQYGFTGSVTLALSGLPSGVTSSFSTNPTTGNSQLTINVSSTAPVGQYNLTLTGTSGSETETTTVYLGISAPSFSLYSYPSNVALNQGTSATSSISVNPQYGFAGSVTFTATGLPTGVTAAFSPNPSTSGSTLTLSVADSAAPGIATVTITGTSGNVTASTSVYLTINTPGFTLMGAPNTVSLLAGGTGKSTVIVTPQNGFSGSVNLSAAGLPSGVAAAFSSNPITPGSSTLTLTANSTATTGNATVTITGTSGSLSSSTSLVVNVGASSTSPKTTTTTIAITSSGSPVTSVAAGSVVTLTSQVSVGSTPLATGQVTFCDATASSCDVLHRIGSAQLTSAGTAVFTFIPGPGTHQYEAVFAGTRSSSTSTSPTETLTVTSAIPTTTTIAQSGSAGNYSLTATVTGKGWPAPSGTVSFLDTNNGNASLGSATLAQSKTSLALQNFQSPAAGGEPEYIATGDFNGDGILDLAIADQNSTSLTILLGNGDGTFAAASSNPQMGSATSSIVSGDFNDDGKLDLAAVNQNGNSISILLGNGDGTFTASTSSPPTGPGPAALVVGDFNGDGIQDLAVASNYAASLTILLGNGDGTFTPSQLSPQTGNSPRSLVSADFNGDGIADLAVVTGGNGVTILLGNGDGSFAPGAVASVGASTYALAIAAADLNGDGAIDLAVTTQNNAIAILLGNGDGTFTLSAASPQTGNSPSAIAIADFNGDGNPDLAIANQYNNNVSIYFGNGDGTFTAWSSISTGNYPIFVATGDFNGDGSPDLAIANYWSNTATVLTSQVTQSSSATSSGISPVGQGQHPVEASYPGDSAYKSSVSSTVQMTARPGVPIVSVTPAAFSILPSQSLSVAVMVADGVGNPIPTGSVVLTSGSFSSTSAILTTGTASITIPAGALSLGADTITAVYTPDTAGALNYLTATGSSVITVSSPALQPTVTVTPTFSTIIATQTDDVTVSVARVAGQPSPTGNVVLSSGSFSVQQPLSGGSATFTIPAGTLSNGANTLTAVYSGDGTYAAATGTASITVAQVGLAVPNPSPIAPGGSATTTVTFTAQSGYAGTMDLACALKASPSGAQSLPTCTLNPASVTLSAGGTATTKLTINTTAASTASLALPNRTNRWAMGSGGATLAFVLIFGVSSRRRRWLSMLAIVAMIAISGVIGCGGGSGSGGSNHGPSTPGTTAGNYTFTVTGTDTANAKITTSVDVTVTVQ